MVTLAPTTAVAGEPFRSGTVLPRPVSMVDKLTSSLRRLSGVGSKKPAHGLDLTGVGLQRDESGASSGRPVFR